ncbi:MAG: hypothetical protein IKI57_00705 [Clostridia bacterium]|nr:hypothetical protein [Clostridia bacterium]
MNLALYISFGVLLALVAATFIMKDPPKWVAPTEVVVFIIYEVLNLIYHPIVGIGVICAFGFICMLLFIDRNDNAIQPKWWKPFLYICLLAFTVAILYQVVEIFTGRLF